MKISNLMNVDFKKFSIDKDRLVIDALDLMDKDKTSILLCIDNKKELKGIITERDLLDRLGSKKFGKLKTSSIRISSVMVYDPEVASPDDSIYEVAAIMNDNGYTGIPIVKDGPVGFVSQNEIIEICRKVNSITVQEIMDKNPIILSEDDRIIHARSIFFEKNTSSILLGSNGKVNGVITEGILSRAFANFRENVPGVHQAERIKQMILNDCKKSPILINNDMFIGEAATLMLEEGVRILVILDENENLLGTITKDILVEFVKNELSLKNYK